MSNASSVRIDAGIYAWVKREESEGRIYQEVDGFFVWSPCHAKDSAGFLNEYALLEMVKYLTAKNALWQWQIDHDPVISGGPDTIP